MTDGSPSFDAPERGDVVIVPAVTVPADFTETVEQVRAGLAGLMPLAERVYRVLLPVAQAVPDTAPDVVHEFFGESTGWSALLGEMMDIAGAFVVATGTHEGDIGWYPEFITDEDRERRDLRDAARIGHAA